MRFFGYIGAFLAVACLQGAVAQPELDTLWMCRDSIQDASPAQLFFRMYLADTFPDNRGPFDMVDTGDSHDGSRYVNFDYQFNTDSVHLAGKTPANTDTVYTIAPRPGYAGFKSYWDNGFVKFYAAQHDSMVFWHKGPLSSHKVEMIWAQGGECGEPINYQYFGEFKSSTEWKRECMPFPEKRGFVSEYPDSPFVKNGLFELRMLIYNEEGDSPTSEKGCLKIDNMGFIKKATGVIRNGSSSYRISGDSRHFIPAASGNVSLAIYSLQGEQLFRNSVNVTGGKKYNIRRFAESNSQLPIEWIQVIKIKGSGVNLTQKFCR